MAGVAFGTLELGSHPKQHVSGQTPAKVNDETFVFGKCHLVSVLAKGV